MQHRLVAIYVGLRGLIEDNTQISGLLSKVHKVMGRKDSCRAESARLLIEFGSASCGGRFLFCALTFLEFLFYSPNAMIYFLNCLHSWCSRSYSLNILRLQYMETYWYVFEDHVSLVETTMETLALMFPGCKEAPFILWLNLNEKWNRSDVKIKPLHKRFLFIKMCTVQPHVLTHVRFPEDATLKHYFY